MNDSPKIAACVEVSGLRKSYGDTEVLKDISFSLKPGSVLSIIGPSGSGKSTLLRCLNSLETAQAGEIVINDSRIDCATARTADRDKLAASSAMVFQQHNLFRNMTALENVRAGVEYGNEKQKYKGTRASLKRAHDLLSSVGTGEHAEKYPVQLSGGQQQRVGIARALAVAPSVLLFDEPTSALDPQLSAEVLRVILDLAKHDYSMIIVTHEMGFASRVSDFVMFMSDGHVVEYGPPEQIFSNPENDKTLRFIEEYSE